MSSVGSLLFRSFKELYLASLEKRTLSLLEASSSKPPTMRVNHSFPCAFVVPLQVVDQHDPNLHLKLLLVLQFGPSCFQALMLFSRTDESSAKSPYACAGISGKAHCTSSLSFLSPP